jgi:nicotinamidase-related amidase
VVQIGLLHYRATVLAVASLLQSLTTIICATTIAVPIMATFASTFNTSDKAAPGHYRPSQTALLVLDFHTLFVQKAGGLEGPAALAVAANMRTWAKSQGIQVIHALVDMNLATYPTCKDAERLAGFMTAMKSGGNEEPPELLEGGGDDVTFTRRPGHASALKSPGLNDFLQKKGITSLVLTGLSTSGCVLRTAVTATDAEYVVTVISDGCADPAEGVHDMIVGKILNNRAYVTTAAEFQEGFTKATSG